MRWKLLRRRLSISAPRVIVRSHLPWPLRWVVAAITLGFCAAIALWAFEFGKDIAGVGKQQQAELSGLRIEVAQLREEREKAQSMANTADSLLKSETVARERLSQALRQVEAENLDLKADLGFFKRVLPTSGNQALSIRSLQADLKTPGKLRYQMLVMQNGKSASSFVGHYQVVLGGTLEGQPWQLMSTDADNVLQVRQVLRVEGTVEHPEQAVVKTVEVRVSDQKGNVVATQSIDA
ncbi:MAG: DUF6776 family protein [Rubrivivax sp.]